MKTDHYLKMLKGFFILHLKRKRKLKSATFQQDGAPPHYALQVRGYLYANFKDRCIGRVGHISWPAWSTDLSPLEFFLLVCKGRSLQVSVWEY